MNALGMTLLGSIAHATLFAIAGTAAYLAIKRRGPAAGSLAAGSSLAIMAVVSIAVLSPWPRWWTFGDAGRSPATVVDARGSGAEEDLAGAGSVATDREAFARAALPPPHLASLSDARPSLFGLILDELRRPADAEGAAGWGWREWLAAGFLASLVLGAARLGIGLWGIARLRAMSRPVVDHELDELIEVLRAEVGCTRSVDVHEADELATPATVGWRHPVLLLPTDWRDWDRDERRAVLAHELAHVRRGDFPAGVAAQTAVAIHFYHPLAHWLAARLRLEQELAADAWGARLSGGKSSYLATLAQMALRRDGRALTWPARAFLPSHGTFVRRIEMLKNQGPIRDETLPFAARVLTVAALVGVGLLVAGLRGPAGDSPLFAQDLAAGQPATAGAETHDLKLVPAEARMILSVRPAALLRRPDVRALLDQRQEGPALRNLLPVPPEDVEQVLLFWESGSADAGRPGLVRNLPAPTGVVVRTSKPQDWKAVLGKLARPGSLAEARHDGQVYYRPVGGQLPVWGEYTPDDRTIVAAEESALRDLISDRNAPAPLYPWDEAWRKVDKGQVMMALDTRWLRREIDRTIPPEGRQGAAGLEMFSPLYNKARSYAISIGVSDRSIAVDLIAAAGSPENVGPVAETLRAMLTLGRNAMTDFHRDAPRPVGDDGPARGWIIHAAESTLANARVETTGDLVRLRSESAIDLAEGIRLLVPAVTRAQLARRRYQSVNNLKQIGLAFHNYHAAMGHFPASVNRDEGAFPYSWRVAILPYLEQQELYNQYRFDEPWDGPNNRKLIDRMPAVYSYPGVDGTPSNRSNPTYFVFTGDSTIGGAEGGAKIQGITDGTSNTLIAAEAKRDIPWTKPEDIPFDPKAPPAEVGGFTPDGFNVLFGDGSVRYLKKSINPIILKALITRNGGEVISTDTY